MATCGRIRSFEHQLSRADVGSVDLHETRVKRVSTHVFASRFGRGDFIGALPGIGDAQEGIMETTPSNSSVAAAWPGASVRGPLKAETRSFDDVKFGFAGIRARYRENPGRMLRCIDPFSLEPVVFATPLQYENWLDRRFDGSIVYVDPSRDDWEVLHHGQQLSVSPHLHWAGWSDKGVLEMVIEPGRESSYQAIETLETVARAHGLKSSVRLAVDIRRDPKLLDLLDRVRQKLVCHMDVVRDASVRGYVLDAVKNEQVSCRGDVMSTCIGRPHDLSRDSVDAVLFWLRRVGAVQFDIVEGRYDDRTAISAA